VYFNVYIKAKYHTALEIAPRCDMYYELTCENVLYMVRHLHVLHAYIRHAALYLGWSENYKHSSVYHTDRCLLGKYLGKIKSSRPHKDYTIHTWSVLNLVCVLKLTLGKCCNYVHEYNYHAQYLYYHHHPTSWQFRMEYVVIQFNSKNQMVSGIRVTHTVPPIICMH